MTRIQHFSPSKNWSERQREPTAVEASDLVDPHSLERRLTDGSAPDRCLRVHEAESQRLGRQVCPSFSSREPVPALARLPPCSSHAKGSTSMRVCAPSHPARSF